MADLALHRLSKRYGENDVVAGIDLEVGAGEFVSLLGPSGCGKTTVLRMIAGLIAPSGGSVLIGGADMTLLPPHKRQLGLVFQSYALFPHLSVRDNVAFGLRRQGVRGAELSRRVAEALALVRLPHLAERMPRQLSGGQQQRVALARAVAPRPRLLLLDEPLSNLDAQLRDEMQIEIKRLQRELGITSIFVTHDQGEALSLSDRVCVMNQGRVQQVGPPEDVYHNPANGFVAGFIGRSNRLRGRVAMKGGGAIVLQLPGGTELRGLGDVPLGAEAEAIIRHEAVRVTEGEGVPGVVVMRAFAGARVQLLVRLDTGTELLSEAPTIDDAYPLQPGMRVGVDIDPRAVFIAEPGR
ncbi:ABC transporter ATP-binding protein [Limobrevibacterium gyesilva]|uniref:ABC transporter ATP-binding protein n=1 Tax=Limobrevibacterium gyesilva TaxID=2991712 RepID=A0AA41YNA7_9PROT|nr:ABC transporter ATP-binding protein [Limobrevibacterium gyesilva]MCW3475860.1 ABC transporter ATP-binding protein [Limobrevibacterium gyesilva]